MAATKTTKKKHAATAKNKGDLGSAPYAKPLLIVLGALIIIGTVWFVLAARHNADAALTSSQKSSQGTGAALHSNNEALKAAAALYQAYLPLKAQTVAAVGDNPNVEPANVQVVRASKVYFSKALYTKFLKDYMSQYQQTGQVTRDDVACVQAATYDTDFLDKRNATTATVNVNLHLPDTHTIRIVLVTVDLRSLKITKIDC